MAINSFQNEIDIEFIKKYNKAGPRYTSYPTAPEWSDSFTSQNYVDQLKEVNKKNEKTPLSLYFHIPFCEQRCLYCGCHSIIDRKKLKGDEYISYLEKELTLFSDYLNKDLVVGQLHWGGGTPTYLNEKQIETLFNSISKRFTIEQDSEIAIEVNPRCTTLSQMKLLKDLGFNRVSLGLQDFNPNVQKAVNRFQSEEDTINLINYSREINYTSVNLDLIYGLPLQTMDSFSETIKKVLNISPDRIAMFSFARIPWLKEHQKEILDKDLPSPDEKLAIFLTAREMLLNSGYVQIGMDHFAKADDELAIALKEKSLHRNFMGYTVKSTDHYVGFGVSSIGYINQAYVQNVKEIEAYYNALDNGRLPVERGMILNNEDLIRQWVITSIMCQFEVDYQLFQNKFGKSFQDYFQEELPQLDQFLEDQLLEIQPDRIVIKEKGSLVVRNIAMVFDTYLRKKQKEKQFSQTI